MIHENIGVKILKLQFLLKGVYLIDSSVKTRMLAVLKYLVSANDISTAKHVKSLTPSEFGQLLNCAKVNHLLI